MTDDLSLLKSNPLASWFKYKLESKFGEWTYGGEYKLGEGESLTISPDGYKIDYITIGEAPAQKKFKANDSGDFKINESDIPLAWHRKS